MIAGEIALTDTAFFLKTSGSGRDYTFVVGERDAKGQKEAERRRAARQIFRSGAVKRRQGLAAWDCCFRLE